MSIALPITPERTGKMKIPVAAVVLLAMALLTGTFMRISLLVLYPVVVVFLFVFFRLRFSVPIFILLGIVAVGFALSFFNGLYLKYKFLSLYFMVPFILLLFSRQPADYRKVRFDYMKIFIRCLVFIAIVNDIVGICQFTHARVTHAFNPDDSFTGIYSKFSISLYGLVIINALLFFHYFSHYLNDKKSGNLRTALFFLFCCILGFYGAGLAAIIVAIVSVFFKFRLKAFLKIISIGLATFAAVYFFMKYANPDALRYNIESIQKLTSFNIENGPRKLIAHYNYIKSYPNDPKDFLFGSGPGTFNSRSAFMSGSPSYFSGVPIVKSSWQPYYFRNYIYPLWNDTNTSQLLFQDGFRNQPFSSVLAFLGEYGLLFTLLFGIFYYRYYRKVIKRAKIIGKATHPYARLFTFLAVLLPMLFLIDNFYESPEMMLLIILSLKLIEIELSKPDAVAD
jgi:hypothetical protein